MYMMKASVLPLISPCCLCGRKCGAERMAGQIGYCGAGEKAVIYQQFIHCGEEIELSPAFIVNMSGCNLHCPTCSERIHWTSATRVWCGEAEEYAEKMVPRLEKANIRSFEWIGGEPSIYFPFVYEATRLMKRLLHKKLPFYLNTNGYYVSELTPYLTEMMDGFVFDLKASRGCAQTIVGPAPDYYDIVCDNIKAASQSACHLIVRHLVMPGHVDCCTKPCVDWLHQNVPKARLNLMTTFQNFNGCDGYPFELSEDDMARLKALGLL